MLEFLRNYSVILSIFLASLLLLLGFVLRGRKPKHQKLECETEDFSASYGYGGDVIIVGAGVAGAALAYSLAKDGRNVRVLERDLRAPDRIAGELLHPGGYSKLIQLGLRDCLDNVDAQTVVGYQFYKDGKNLTLTYPCENFTSHVTARSFYNGRFVQRLREKAASLPNLKLEQGTVMSLVEEQGVVKGVHYKTKNGEELTAYAPLTIVCDGCASNLRRSLCSPSPKVDVPSYFVGVVLKNCQLSLPDHAQIVLGDPSMILFYPISSVEIRCLVDVPIGPDQKLPSLANGEMAEYMKTIVAPQVPAELYEAFVAAVDEGNIRTLPNRSMPATLQRMPGALLVGDAFNMRHPFTGGGMTVALSDIVVLRDVLRPLKDLNDLTGLCKCLDSFYTLRKPAACIINTLAGLFYEVFCASPDEAHKEMRNALFDYLGLGGECSTGPTGLLGGLYPQPLRLAAHLMAVAIYAFGRLLLPFPSPKRLWLGLRVLMGASGIIYPLLKAERLGQMFLPAKLSAFN
ncbi:squalene monooxygenase SE1-like [Silene latifolia]|uniref:squalene monooxygenase SE1-like n=1 Tax=Silene latifolia TaxID=37657 RepID=UPI003D779A4D